MLSKEEYVGRASVIAVKITRLEDEVVDLKREYFDSFCKEYKTAPGKRMKFKSFSLKGGEVRVNDEILEDALESFQVDDFGNLFLITHQTYVVPAELVIKP